MPDQQNILVIIPLIAGREDHFQRTINAMFTLGYEGSILAIRGKGIKASRFQNPHLMITSKTYNLNGMASIFQAIELESNLIKQYKYVTYCDDDNLINPIFIQQAASFLHLHQDYAGCNGRRLLCEQTDAGLVFLAQYATQRLEAGQAKHRLQQYCQQGGILFYAFLQTEVLLESVAGIESIDDDNVAEILINYRLPKFGKFALLSELQLARPYPRPTIFNIPDILSWLRSENMQPSMMTCLDMLICDYDIDPSMKAQNNFFMSTIGCYLQRRFRAAPLRTVSRFFKPITNICFSVLYGKKISRMLDALNDENRHVIG